MKIFFRVDSSIKIGSGHLFRCLTLATELKKNGHCISFICEEQEGYLGELIVKKGFHLYILPLSKEYSSKDCEIPESKYDDWISVSEIEDAFRTIEIIKGCEGNVDWMIVDHYALNAPWEKELSLYVDNIMVIDDLADRNHECSILLNQNLHADLYYKDNNPPIKGCRHLLGLKYAMLDASYRNLRNEASLQRDKVKNILIYFGGADQDNLTGRTLNTIVDLDRSDLTVNVVIPSSHVNSQDIEEIVSNHTNIYLHKGYVEMAPLILEADLAIGAGGSSNWERCCLGLPSIIVAMSENQLPIAKALQKEGVVKFIEDSSENYSMKLLNCLCEVFQMKTLKVWSKQCKKLVDGKGVQRVAKAIL